MEGTVQIGRAIDQHQGNGVSIHRGIPNNCGKDNEKRETQSEAERRIPRKPPGMADNGGMAVYTTPDPMELAALCRRLGLGAPEALQPVAAGVENSTWFLSLEAAGSPATEREWVLTIVEQADVEALQFPAALCARLREAGLPVPAPRPDPDGTLVHRLAGKPALLQQMLPPLSPPTLQQERCCVACWPGGWRVTTTCGSCWSGRRCSPNVGCACW